MKLFWMKVVWNTYLYLNLRFLVNFKSICNFYKLNVWLHLEFCGFLTLSCVICYYNIHWLPASYYLSVYYNNYTVYSESGMFIFKQVCSVCIMEYWCENLWYIILQEGIFMMYMVCNSTHTLQRRRILLES